MDRLLQDLAHALRRLARAPGFTTVAVLTLALGIGANTAIFSLVQAVLLRPLPYGAPERLVALWGVRDKGETTWLSGPEVESYVADTDVFASVAAYSTSSANLTGGMEPERVAVAAVTPNLFATLRVNALVGRTFAAGQPYETMADQIVLSHGLWQRRFGGDPGVVGSRIQFNGESRLVIGITPPSFKLPLDIGGDRLSDIWYPLDPSSGLWTSWGNHSLIGVARLADAATPERATAAMRALEERWVQDGHWSNRNLTGRAATPLKELVLGDVRYALWVLLGAVGVILLIACANVANLMLARSDERQREVAVRAALGASRSRIIRQLLTESTLLSVVGGALGISFAYLALRAMVALRPAGIPRIEDVGLDAVVLAVTLALAVLTGILFGLAPALELSRPDMNRSLRDGGRTGTVGRARQRFRDGLAVAQLAFSVVLLIGAVLLVRSFLELRGIDPGFSARNALTVRVELPSATYPEAADVSGFFTTVRHRLAQLPGVESVGATRLLPLTGTIGDWSITIEGRARTPEENPNGDWQVVTPGYFETMGMRLVDGRFFADTDTENAPIVAVVSDAMARRYWPGENAVGRRFLLGTDPSRPWITIVGVAAPVRHNAITESPRAEMYIPHAQWPVAGASPRRGMTFVIATSDAPLAVLPHVRDVVRALDPNLPLADVRTLDDVTRDSLAEARFTTLLLALFAALALTLATVGIYGVIALLVARRRQEIGIRMALGARPTAILGMVLRRGLALAAIGVLAGLGAAALLTGVVASLLYGVTRFDPVTFALVPLMLASVALVACLIPASRAARLDPLVALREE